MPNDVREVRFPWRHDKLDDETLLRQAWNPSTIEPGVGLGHHHRKEGAFQELRSRLFALRAEVESLKAKAAVMRELCEAALDKREAQAG